jgi:DNA replication and repair protein RecF
VRLDRVEVQNFRSYREARLDLAPGLTVLIGANGSGKTNLLEAIGYLARLSSFRGAPTEALVRSGVVVDADAGDAAVVRGFGEDGERRLEIETEIAPGRRNRTLVNKQPLARVRELARSFSVSVFSPDDLVLVKGGPGERRDYLDELIGRLHPRNEAILTDFDRILRQRNALLKQSGGRLDASAALTLDVWDAKLGSVGTEVARLRCQLVDRLGPLVERAYADIADRPAAVTLTTHASWSGSLADALVAGRNDDVRRGVSLLGPHRDDVEARIQGRPSRTHASQGEQRTLSLSMRLAGHRLLAEELGSTPLLLLDDVFSELDPDRSDALIRHLPAGQAVLATAGVLPAAAAVELVYRVARGADERSELAVDNLGETVDSKRAEHREATVDQGEGNSR